MNQIFQIRLTKADDIITNSLIYQNMLQNYEIQNLFNIKDNKLKCSIQISSHLYTTQANALKQMQLSFSGIYITVAGQKLMNNTNKQNNYTLFLTNLIQGWEQITIGQDLTALLENNDKVDILVQISYDI